MSPPDSDTDRGHMSRVYDVVIPGLWERGETHSGMIHMTQMASDPSQNETGKYVTQILRLPTTSHQDGQQEHAVSPMEKKNLFKPNISNC